MSAKADVEESLDVVTRKVEPAIDAQAWRVEFVEDPTICADGVEWIEISEPRKVTAVLAPLDTSVALSRAEAETAGELTVVWLPPGVKTPATIERDADEWIRASGARRKEVNVRADVRTVRILWGENRALIYAKSRRHSLRSRRDRPVQPHATRGPGAGSDDEVRMGVDRGRFRFDPFRDPASAETAEACQ